VNKPADRIRIEKEIAAAERALVKKRIPMTAQPQDMPLDFQKNSAKP
jgi:hypothetical protein